MRKRIIRPALAVFSVLALGAGCGLGDSGPRPGVAADVEGEVLTVDDVDMVIEDYCEVYDAYEGQGSTPIAISALRTYLVQTWISSAAVDAILEERGLPPVPETPDEDVETFWAQLGELDDDTIDGFRLLTRIQVTLNDGLAAIGEDVIAEAGQVEPPSEDDVIQAGETAVTAWLSEQDVEVNPVFGELADAAIELSPSRLSVAVSDPAAMAQTATSFDAAPEDVLELPADQRCGPDELPPAAPVPMG